MSLYNNDFIIRVDWRAIWVYAILPRCRIKKKNIEYNAPQQSVCVYVSAEEHVNVASKTTSCAGH